MARLGPWPVLILPIAVVLGGASAARAQHCAPFGMTDPESASPRYKLIKVERGGAWDWDHLTFAWEDAGTRTATFTISVARGFYKARFFVSPAGNGFLVTGSPHAEKDQPGGPMLFEFYDPAGEAVTRVPVDAVLAADERRTRFSCGGEEGPGCYAFYVYAEEPRLIEGGGFVALRTEGKGRLVTFFLPLAMAVTEENERLLVRELAAVPEAVAADRAAAEAAVAELGSEDPSARRRAEKALRSCGSAAVLPLEWAVASPPSKEAGAEARRVLATLEPWRRAGGERWVRDLRLVAGLLASPSAALAGAARDRLARILPREIADDLAAKGPVEAAARIEALAEKLRWDEASGTYRLAP